MEGIEILEHAVNSKLCVYIFIDIYSFIVFPPVPSRTKDLSMKLHCCFQSLVTPTVWPCMSQRENVFDIIINTHTQHKNNIVINIYLNEEM